MGEEGCQKSGKIADVVYDGPFEWKEVMIFPMSIYFDKKCKKKCNATFVNNYEKKILNFIYMMKNLPLASPIFLPDKSKIFFLE